MAGDKKCLATLLVESDIVVVTVGFNLSAFEGSDGFKIIGENVGDLAAGYAEAVSSAGDVNGDGYDDLIVGARGHDEGGFSTGASYVVFGKASGFATVNLDDVALGSGGFKIVGESAYDEAGISASSAGDVNGDGFGDVIVGAPGNINGAAYVVFGKASGFATVNLSDVAAGTGGFKIIAENAFDNAGFSVSSAGDVNGDGFDDLIVGAHLNDAGGSNAGAAYVVFGKASGFATVNLSSVAAGTGGFKIFGENAGDVAARSVSSAGDVNGDGFGDVIVGAIGNDEGGGTAGAAYVVFGKAGGFATVNLDNVALGTGGFKIVGESAADQSGSTVSSAGDVNGDGFDDLIVGARFDDETAANAGAAYVVFGKAGGFSTVNLSDVAVGTGGFKIVGENEDDEAGVSVSSAGDVNGDGFDDLIVGANFNDAGGSNAGASYVVFGKAGGFATVNLDNIALGTDGFKIIGENAHDYAGRSVSAAGDVNGDGFDDLIVGADGNDAGGGNAGSGYVVFGGDFSGGVTFTGDETDNTLTSGTAAAETFVAGDGNDTIDGGGGADVFRGGAGDDEIHIDDMSFQRIDGGGNFDTLVVDATDLDMDLWVLADNTISGIEKIDMTGGGNDTLTLGLADVLAISDETNDLFVDGNTGDVVLMNSIFSTSSQITVGSVTYDQWVIAGTDAVLNIDEDITAIVD